jgi:dihydroflavonol-4-reductase
VTSPREPDAPRGVAAVTGASGFVGVNLISRLCDEGWQVRAVARRPLPDLTTGRVELRRVDDIRDQPQLEDAFEGVDVVFHLAARISLFTEDPSVWDVNVNGPRAVGRAALAQGVRRLVHCSSVHAFDVRVARGPVDETCPRSISPTRPIYDRSKAAGEAALRTVIDEGLDAVIINPTGILGPVDAGPSRINRLLRLASRGHLPVVLAGGFDWVDVRDVALGLTAALDRGRTGENYLISGHRLSSLELSRMAARAGGHRGPRVAIPLGLLDPLAPLGNRIGRRLGSDIVTPASLGALRDFPAIDGTKAAAELGYAPRSIERTVAELVESFSTSTHRVPL